MELREIMGSDLLEGKAGTAVVVVVVIVVIVGEAL
jgi:hypothetical protein